MYVFYLLLSIPVFSVLMSFTPTDPTHIFKTKVCENRVRRIFGDIEEYKKNPFSIKGVVVKKHDQYHVYSDEFDSNKQYVFEEKVPQYDVENSRSLASVGQMKVVSSTPNIQYKHLFSRYKDLVNNVVIIEANGRVQSVSYQNMAFCDFSHETKCSCN